MTGNEILNSYNYGIVILEEAMDVKVSGNIVYASSNVEITGKKTATVLESTDQTAAKATESTQRETDADGALTIAPVSVNSANKQSAEEGANAKLAYILYE